MTNDPVPGSALSSLPSAPAADPHGSDIDLLHRISVALIGEQDLQSLYAKVVDAAVAITASQFGTMQLLCPPGHPSGHGGELQLLCSRGFAANTVAFWQWVPPTALSSCTQALKRGQRAIIADYEEWPPIAGSADLQAFRDAGIRAAQTTPLVSRNGTLLGMISTHWCAPHQPSERDLRLLDILARQAADLLERTAAEEALRAREQELRQTCASLREIEERQAHTAAQLRALNETLEQRVAERSAELMQAQDTLRQAQKMEAVGQLTGGLAHDFNNLLGGISGSLDMVSRRLAQGRLDEIDKFVATAQDASSRAAALTHRLLAFSRRQTLDPRPTDVNELVLGMSELIQRSTGPAIDLETHDAAELWPALVDKSQLENALLNLCINARDAMPDGGRIVIRSHNRSIAAHDARPLELLAGDYLCLAVEDSGCGMPPEVTAHAFEPFFTTKPTGKGTGLGLSMVYGFAQQSGGQVRIDSVPGQGTRVTLLLPRYHGPMSPSAAVTLEAGAAPAEAAQACILLVEDEPSMRMVLATVLAESGYRVTEAEDGRSALGYLHAGHPVDLLVTDVGLPGGLNGRQLAEAGQHLRPGLITLFITGYAENAGIGDGQLGPDMHVLTKPFAIGTLTDRVEALLTQRSAS
ncbi:GAF domain-containing hybrid sensor histidine kinase/response regulator [Pseudomonas wadenswilerensis]